MYYRVAMVEAMRPGMKPLNPYGKYIKGIYIIEDEET